jgi:hypothetical protein
MRITTAEWTKLKVALAAAEKCLDGLSKADRYWVTEALDCVEEIEDRLAEANERAAKHMKQVRDAKKLSATA